MVLPHALKYAVAGADEAGGPLRAAAFQAHLKSDCMSGRASRK
jgi:hypothetical protein